MKILLSAFACYPGYGSEPGIGWQLARHLARDHEVWVLTDGRNAPGIRPALQEGSWRMPEVRFVDLGIGYTFAHRLYYLVWQVRAYFHARSLQRRVDFDLIHHVTYITSWPPSFMGWLDVPFVWSSGPKERTPAAFLRHMSLKGAAAEVRRNIALPVLSRLSTEISGRRASVVLSSSAPPPWPDRPRVQQFPLGGLTQEELTALGQKPIQEREGLRMASVGRLLGSKGFALGVRAFARFRRDFPASEYWIVGDGPERPYLERLTHVLGIEGAVRFLGSLPRQEVFRTLAEVDVLVHPSLHEQFGFVMAEAMAAGRPVVCLDIGAARVLIAQGCGHLVPVTSPAGVVQSLYRALTSLAQDAHGRRVMGMAAREWIGQYWSWDAVARRVTRVYQDVVA